MLPEEDDTVWRPSARSWSLLHEMTAQVRDRLGDLAMLVADLPVAVKERHKPPPAFPRPETAMSRARAQVRARREAVYDEQIHDFVKKAQERWSRMSPEEQEAMTQGLG